jgi:hypothetical protein
MIEALMDAVVHAERDLAAERRRLDRMSVSALHREMLLHGLLEYEEVPVPEDDDGADLGLIPYLLTDRTKLPNFADY